MSKVVIQWLASIGASADGPGQESGCCLLNARSTRKKGSREEDSEGERERGREGELHEALNDMSAKALENGADRMLSADR